MGPRQGSPAAETHMILILGLAISGLWQQPALAASAEVEHTVSVVVVRPALSIGSNSRGSSLPLYGSSAAGESEAQSVEYRLAGNTLPASACDGVLSARIESPAEGIVLQADVGSFTNDGTPGNAVLQEQLPGFQRIGETSVPLAAKPGAFGPQAAVLNGTLPVTWKATTSEEISAGRHTMTVILTLKES